MPAPLYSSSSSSSSSRERENEILLLYLVEVRSGSQRDLHAVLFPRQPPLPPSRRALHPLPRRTSSIYQGGRDGELDLASPRRLLAAARQRQENLLPDHLSDLRSEQQSEAWFRVRVRRRHGSSRGYVVCSELPTLLTFLAGESSSTALDDAMTRVMVTCLTNSGITSASKDILALGIQQKGYSNNQCVNANGNSDAWTAFIRWVGMAGDPSYDIVTDASSISSINFLNYKMIYLPSQKAVAQCSDKFSYLLCDIESNLTARKFDLQDYVNVHHGSIFSLEQTVLK